MSCVTPFGCWYDEEAPLFRVLIIAALGVCGKQNKKRLKGMNVKKFYEAPEMEMIQLTVEAGFAASMPAGTGGSDGGLTDGDSSDSAGW